MFFSNTTKSSLRRLAVAVATVGLLGAVAGCTAGTSTSGSSASASRGGTLTVATQDGPPTLDPGGLSGVGGWIWANELAYDPLIKLAADGGFQPDLATKWGYVGQGNKQFQFTLRNGVTFADGSKLDAAAAVASIKYILTQPDGGWVGHLKTVEATGPMSVTLGCDAACPDLPFFLSQTINIGSLISPAGLKDPKALADKTFGAGPYVLDPTQTVANDHYTYVANTHYWNPSNVHYAKVVLRVIPDATARLASLTSGQVNLVDQVPGISAKSTESQGYGLTSTVAAFEGLVIMDRTGKISKPLADARVRQALNFAVDRQAIAKAVGQGYSTPTAQMTSPGSGAYSKSLDDTYPYDPKKAKDLLNQAGYPNGFTVSVETQGTSGIDQYTQAAISYWQKIGVKVDLTTDATTSAYNQNVQSGKFPIAAYAFGTLPYSIQSQLFFVQPHSSFGSLEPDPALIAKLNSAYALPAAQADVVYKDVNKQSVEDAYGVPLVVLDQIFASDKKVSVPAGSPGNWLPLLPDVTPAG